MVVSRVVTSRSSKTERHEGAVSRGLTRVLVAAGATIVQTVVVWIVALKGRNIGIRDQVNILSSTGDCDFALLYVGDIWTIAVRHNTPTHVYTRLTFRADPASVDRCLFELWQRCILHPFPLTPKGRASSDLL